MKGCFHGLFQRLFHWSEIVCYPKYQSVDKAKLKMEELAIRALPKLGQEKTNMTLEQMVNAVKK